MWELHVTTATILLSLLLWQTFSECNFVEFCEEQLVGLMIAVMLRVQTACAPTGRSWYWSFLIGWGEAALVREALICLGGPVADKNDVALINATCRCWVVIKGTNACSDALLLALTHMPSNDKFNTKGLQFQLLRNENALQMRQNPRSPPPLTKQN